MTAVTATPPLAVLAALVLVPLVREYLSYRREWGVGPLGALLTTFSLLPALALALVVAAPLSAEPAFQWLVTVVVTLLGYSLAAAAVRTRFTDAAQRPS